MLIESERDDAGIAIPRILRYVGKMTLVKCRSRQALALVELFARVRARRDSADL